MRPRITIAARIFARYSLIGALSMAVGSLMAGLSDGLAAIGVAHLTSFRLMFYLYALLGVLSAVLYRQLPRAEFKSAQRPAPFGPSRGIVYRLAALFSIDAFAGGFIVQSLFALWLFERIWAVGHDR